MSRLSRTMVAIHMDEPKADRATLHHKEDTSNMHAEDIHGSTCSLSVNDYRNESPLLMHSAQPCAVSLTWNPVTRGNLSTTLENHSFGH